ALKAARRAIELNGQFGLGHFSLARALHDKGDVDAAIAAYRKAIAVAPKYAQAHSNLGVLLAEHKKDDDGAIAAYRAAVAANPRFAEADKAYHNLGAALLRKGNRDGAVEAYRKAIA